MDITYTMIGADGQQYGPVAQAQLMDWVREGRVTAATQVLRSDLNSWLAAAQYPELGLSQSPLTMAGATPPPMSQTAPLDAVANAALMRRARSGAGWFFWIGGFSLVNSIMLMTGDAHRFLIGLGVTDIIALGSRSAGSAGMVVALVLNLLVLGLFVTFGIFARKGHSWSFIAGIVCYALDAGILLLLGADMISIGFHGIALVFMIMGLVANMKLKALRRGTVA